jgi:SAM-dependent methyltransferase
LKCQICGNSDNNKMHTAREMMFGTGEEFAYFECGSCGCLQIIEPPRDMAPYYPSAYYVPEEKALGKNHVFGKENLLLKLVLNSRRLLGDKVVMKTLALLYHNSDLLKSVESTKIMFNSRILEVGCGKGVLMVQLEAWGFENVIGADLYAFGKAAKDLQIVRTSTEAFSPNCFELIIFDHSFEHMPNQLETLARVSEIMTEHGACLIRIPVKTEFIWKRYRTNWVQLDAPRHFFIHTQKSMKILAEKVGLHINRTVFDSTAFQFWGSEQYQQNIPLRAKGSYSEDRENSLFSQNQIKEYQRMAKKLNESCQGDQATFLLQKDPK